MLYLFVFILYLLARTFFSINTIKLYSNYVAATNYIETNYKHLLENNAKHYRLVYNCNPFSRSFQAYQKLIKLV